MLDLHPREVGRRAVELLIGRIDGADREPAQGLIGTDLLVRGCTAASVS